MKKPTEMPDLFGAADQREFDAELAAEIDKWLAKMRMPECETLEQLLMELTARGFSGTMWMRGPQRIGNFREDPKLEFRLDWRQDYATGVAAKIVEWEKMFNEVSKEYGAAAWHDLPFCHSQPDSQSLREFCRSFCQQLNEWAEAKAEFYSKMKVRMRRLQQKWKAERK